MTFCILGNNSASDPSQNSCKPLGKLSRENGLEMMATFQLIEISLAHGDRPFYLGGSANHGTTSAKRNHLIESYSMIKRSQSLILVSLLIIINVVCQPLPQNSNAGNSSRPLNMLVLGDSILWGQGLKPEHKSWYQVKAWLERTTGRKVVERIEAHSGTVIELASTDDRLSASNPEVNVALPTMNDQLDAAVKSYADASQVDLVLLSGCGNDVGVQTFSTRLALLRLII